MAEVADTSARDDFLEWIETTLRQAEVALHDGDPGPRLTIWSTHEPVSVFGAWRNAIGRPAVEDLFHALAESFSESTRCEMEIIAADVVGDMAYTVAIERTSTSVDGAPRTYALRATQVYRREDGAWRVVHRHADELTDG
jgi:uncharacterized protein (TIGR02246 family)